MKNKCSRSRVEHITDVVHHIVLHCNRVEISCVLCCVVVINICVLLVRCNGVMLMLTR